MKKFKQNLKQRLAPMIAVFPFRMLQRISHRVLLVINYHSKKNVDPDPIINKNIYRTEQEFEKDIIFLKKNFHFVTLYDVLEDNISSKYTGKKCVLLTFDDGLRVVYDRCRPILLRHGVSATIFVNPCFVDNADLHYQRKKNLILHTVTQKEVEAQKAQWESIFSGQGIKGKCFEDCINLIDYKKSFLLQDISVLFGVDFKQYLNDYPIYLSSAQIQEMISEGFTFGGHSMDHPRYDELDLNTQLKQTLDSIEWVCNQFDVDYRVFAFPLRDHSISIEFFNRIQGKCDFTFGVRGLGEDVIDNHIQRIDVESRAMHIETVLKYEYLKYTVRCLLGKKKYGRK